ncbi:hypothetical protein AMJ83_05640 [candidate division WOR_3 bacterium SM23_42]|uniref:Gingipain domain-containing protein n=1 Tax=candidate division WOR_3 bacterium SM23_42 TaxID=1703779 RepID=A0A0S8FSJ8_UNCW3|nr:MAG: hypothetical protein AMJ83_05640 [candidate division WOR_3 bacterium SM23_42]
MLSSIFIVLIVGNTTISELGTTGVEISFSMPEVRREDYSFPEAMWLNKSGEPNLPSLLYKVGIPQDGDVVVTVVGHDETVFRNVVVDPVYYVAVDEEPLGEKIDFHGEVYKLNALFPDRLIDVSKPGYFRDLYTVDVRINPVRYNPITKELRVTRNVRIEIKFRGQPKVGGAVDAAYDDIYERTIVNYRQCRNWRRIARPLRQNPFVGATWYKIEVEDEGIYRIGMDELTNAGLDPEQFDPRTMKIYTAPFDVLPRTVPMPDSLDSLIQIPVYVYGEEDGVFDQNDYLIFYGYSASHFVPATDVVWFENGYALSNVYWFTFGGADGLRMEQVDAQWDGTTPDTTVNAIVHNEIDLGNPTRSGTNWYWADVSPLSSDMGSAQITIGHPEAAGMAQVRVAMFALNSAQFWYRFSINGATFFNDTLYIPAQPQMPPIFLTGTGALTGDSSALLFEVMRPAGVMTSLEEFLNAVDISYERKARLNKPFHVLFTATTSYSVKCTEVETEPFVLDITELNLPKMLSNLTIGGSVMQLSGAVDSFQMLYFSKLSLAETAELQPASPGRLRTQGDGCEYIVITHEDFYTAIMPLVEYRSREYLTKLVVVDDIYDDFAFGKYDPLAIKHFLYYTMNNWSPYPKYVLLVGDATYDYKNNLGKDNPPNFVPMYEYGTYLSGSPVFSNNSLYEGEYVNFGQGEVMCLGRITVRSRQEVRDYIDKVVTYETGDIVGPWTKRVLLTADDEYAYGFEYPTIHTGACERNSDNIPDSLYDFAKVYMISYPPLGAGTAEKANAREAFIREFNRGALMGIFYGHGNTHQLAHEVLFLSPYVGRLNNGRRYPFFYFGSCNVSRFNDSDFECLGEEFVRTRDGAIGTIGCTAGSYSGENEVIGGRLCASITDPDTTLTMGECSVIARGGYWTRQYLLIGDPATRFRKMYHPMYLASSPDSVRPIERLGVVADNERYHLTASVRDTTIIDKFDASTADRISGRVGRDVQTGSSSYIYYEYAIDGKQVYVGYWDNDTATIIAPRVSTTHLPVIKLSSVYGDQSGLLDSLRVYGTAMPTADNTGPEVALYAGGRLLKDDDWVSKQFTLNGRVADSSGINLLYSVESTNGFYLYINSDLDSKIDLRDYFYYNKNSFTSGEFSVEIDLPEAVDTLTINVVDNNFNQTVYRLVLNTEVFGQIAFEDFLVYPNPLRTDGGSWFTFNLTRSGLVQLKIFTIAGRLIKTIDNVSCTVGYNQVYWDGLDNFQDEISNGVYIVKAFVEADNSRAEVIEKFIIAR